MRQMPLHLLKDLLAVICCLSFIIAGCAGKKLESTSQIPGVSYAKKKKGDIVGITEIGSRLYILVKLQEPLEMLPDQVGFPYSEIPSDLKHPTIRYTLAKKGSAITIIGTVAYRLSEDRRSSTLIIPRRQVENFMRSFLEKGTYTLSDMIARPTSGEIIEAVRKRDFETIKELLNIGLDVNERDSRKDQTALMHAVKTGDKDIVELLVNRGADVKLKEKNGATALLFTAFYGHEHLIQTLLKKGADINSKDNEGVTALMLASGKGYTRFVQILIEKGADVNLKRDNGKTALMYATFNGYADVVQILIDKGAVVNASDYMGNNALQVAKEKGRFEIAKILNNALIDVDRRQSEKLAGNDIKLSQDQSLKLSDTSYSKKKILLNWYELGPSFSFSDKGGISVGSEKYPIIFSTNVLKKDSLAQIKELMQGSLNHLTKEAREKILNETIQMAVVECSAKKGILTFKSSMNDIIDEHGIIHKGHGFSGRSLGSGPIPYFYGIFVFRGFCHWDTIEGRVVGLKDCVFVTEKDTLYLKAGSKIKSSNWFTIGNFEILGEIEIHMEGIKILNGTKYRNLLSNK